MASPKRQDNVLDSVAPALKQLCLNYSAAREEAKQAGATARAASQARDAARRKTSRVHEQIDEIYQMDGVEKNRPFPAGTVLFNVRTGRLYEAVEGEERHYQTCRHLNPNTGYGYHQHRAYVWGPLIPLPESHPFVQKRVNARLAERLKGEGD